MQAHPREKADRQLKIIPQFIMNSLTVQFAGLASLAAPQTRILFSSSSPDRKPCAWEKDARPVYAC